MFLSIYVTCDYSFVTFVSLSVNLRHPRDFTSHTSRRGTLYCIEMRFVLPFGIYIFFRPRSFLVLSAPWHAGSQPEPRTQVWALDEVRGTCSGGLKSHIPSGRPSERVEPSRSLQTHVQVNRITDGPCDIWDLECHQCRRTILTW